MSSPSSSAAAMTTAPLAIWSMEDIWNRLALPGMRQAITIGRSIHRIAGR